MKIKYLYISIFFLFCFQANGHSATRTIVPPIKMYIDSSFVADNSFVEAEKEVTELLRKCRHESNIAIASLVILPILLLSVVILFFIAESAVVGAFILLVITLIVGLVSSISSLSKLLRIKSILKKNPILKNDPSIASSLSKNNIRVMINTIIYGVILLRLLLLAVISGITQGSITLGILGLLIFLLSDKFLFETKKKVSSEK